MVSVVIVNALFNKVLEVFAPYLKKRIIKKLIEKNSGDQFDKQAYALEIFEVLKE